MDNLHKLRRPGACRAFFAKMGCMKLNEQDDVNGAFRKHRHDVLNGLQLVKAYMQLNKPVEAMDALDRLSNWLRSLSVIQAQCMDSNLLWAAAQCPHICVEDVQLSPLTGPFLKEVMECLVWLDACANEQGVRRMSVRLGETGASYALNQGQVRKISVQLDATEETMAWWNNRPTGDFGVHKWMHVEVSCCMK
jgi:hypothetical protein